MLLLQSKKQFKRQMFPYTNHILCRHLLPCVTHCSRSCAGECVLVDVDNNTKLKLLAVPMRQDGPLATWETAAMRADFKEYSTYTRSHCFCKAQLPGSKTDTSWKSTIYSTGQNIPLNISHLLKTHLLNSLLWKVIIQQLRQGCQFHFLHAKRKTNEENRLLYR